MAVEHGIPGEWARVRGVFAALFPLFVACGFLGAFLAACALGRQTGLFATCFIASALGFVFAWQRCVKRLRAFFVGARGEERVASVLCALGDDWHVFHDFKAGPFRVDHVVAGPGGVYSVETKNWRGRVTRDGDTIAFDGAAPFRQPLPQAQREADAVKRALAAVGWEGSVHAVLCFASDTFDSPVGTHAVTAVNARDFVAWLLARPRTLPADACERLVRLLETRHI